MISPKWQNCKNSCLLQLCSLSTFQLLQCSLLQVEVNSNREPTYCKWICEHLFKFLCSHRQALVQHPFAVVQPHHHDISWVLADALHWNLQCNCHSPWVRNACCSGDTIHAMFSLAKDQALIWLLLHLCADTIFTGAQRSAAVGSLRTAL